MGTNCAPLLIKFAFILNEAEFILNLLVDKKKKNHIAEFFNFLSDISMMFCHSINNILMS